MALAALLAGGPALADTLVLTNGTRIDGVTAWREGDVVYCLRFGAVVGYPAGIVAAVEPGSVAPVFGTDAAPSASQDDGPESEDSVAPSSKDFSGEVFGEVPDEIPGEIPGNAAGSDSDAKGDRFRVARVYDGDTFRAKGHGVEVTVRVVGIDAPETAKKGRPGQPLAGEAKAALSRMIQGRDVRVQGYGQDRYRRQLAEVFVDGLNVGIELARLGLAEVYSGKPPDGLDLEPYRQAQAEAQRRNRGLWEPGRDPVSPSRWRERYSR